MEAAILDRQAECFKHKSGNPDMLHVLAVQRFKDARLQNHLGIGGVDFIGTKLGARKMALLVSVSLPDAGRAADEFESRFHDHADIVVKRFAGKQPLPGGGMRQIVFQHLARHGAVKIALRHTHSPLFRYFYDFSMQCPTNVQQISHIKKFNSLAEYRKFSCVSCENVIKYL